MEDYLFTSALLWQLRFQLIDCRINVPKLFINGGFFGIEFCSFLSVLQSLPLDLMHFCQHQ
jgi:hypothetical protein